MEKAWGWCTCRIIGPSNEGKWEKNLLEEETLGFSRGMGRTRQKKPVRTKYKQKKNTQARFNIHRASYIAAIDLEANSLPWQLYYFGVICFFLPDTTMMQKIMTRREKPRSQDKDVQYHLVTRRRKGRRRDIYIAISSLQPKRTEIFIEKISTDIYYEESKMGGMSVKHANAYKPYKISNVGVSLEQKRWIIAVFQQPWVAITTDIVSFLHSSCRPRRRLGVKTKGVIFFIICLIEIVEATGTESVLKTSRNKEEGLIYELKFEWKIQINRGFEYSTQKKNVIKGEEKYSSTICERVS